MQAKQRVRIALALLAALLVLTSAATSSARGKHGGSQKSKKTESCQHPCTRVDDCPKVSCECEGGTASDVAICDTEKTHCCGSASTACRRFCEVHKQKWTGRFSSSEAAPQTAPTPAEDQAAETPTSTCDEPCTSAEDCRTMTCECAHGTAENVAACGVKTRCCGSPRVVCEHFCDKKKGKWTGKVVADSPPETGDSLGDLLDDEPGE